MYEKIPSNVIIKSSYRHTLTLLNSNYLSKIQDQIIQYIKDYPNNYDNIEIEARFGEYYFKGEAVKEFAKINEAFIIPEFTNYSYRSPLNNPHKIEFNAGIPPSKFYLIWGALDKESKLKGSNIEFLGAFTYKDMIYKNGKRNSTIYSDHKTAIKEETIRKEDKKQINIRHYGNDFRISCCKEMPTEIIDSDELEMERDKFRVSYQLSFYRFDLTISKDTKSDDYSYEIEIEINKLKNVLNGKKNPDFLMIRAIIDRFLQNVLNLYSVLIPEAVVDNFKHDECLGYELGTNKNLHPDEIKSKFGNYFKNFLPKNANTK